MMPDNDWYGHRTALARYCGLDRSSPAVFGSIRHGWQPDLGDIGVRRIASAPIFVWNRREADQAVERGIPNVEAIGAPFLYGVANLSAGTSGPPAGAGTIVFPFHSGGGGDVAQDRARLIAEVEAHEAGPYTASIFYQDLDRPEFVEPFRREGWRIVSFGTRAEPLFLTRLILELEAHATVVGDALGSALWYGAHLGRRVRVIGEPPTVTLRNGRVPDLARYEEQIARWPAIHGPGIEGADAIGQAAVELGADCMRPPDELAELLGWRSWRRIAAPAVRLAIDLRHGDDLRRGAVLGRALRRPAGR